MLDNSYLNKSSIAGCNFWSFGGTGRAAINRNYWWSEGDNYLGDPPPEEQGLNTVFDNDASTWKLIKLFATRLQ